MSPPPKPGTRHMGCPHIGDAPYGLRWVMLHVSGFRVSGVMGLGAPLAQDMLRPQRLYILRPQPSKSYAPSPQTQDILRPQRLDILRPLNILGSQPSALDIMRPHPSAPSCLPATSGRFHGFFSVKQNSLSASAVYLRRGRRVVHCPPPPHIPAFETRVYVSGFRF